MIHALPPPGSDRGLESIPRVVVLRALSIFFSPRLHNQHTSTSCLLRSGMISVDGMLACLLACLLAFHKTAVEELQTLNIVCYDEKTRRSRH